MIDKHAHTEVQREASLGRRRHRLRDTELAREGRRGDDAVQTHGLQIPQLVQEVLQQARLQVLDSMVVMSHNDTDGEWTLKELPKKSWSVCAALGQTELRSAWQATRHINSTQHNGSTTTRHRDSMGESASTLRSAGSVPWESAGKYA